MNSNIKFILGIVMGGTCGIVGTYILCKKKYDKKFQIELQNEIETLRGLYSNKYEKEKDTDIIDFQNFTDDNCDEVFEDLLNKTSEDNSIDKIKIKKEPKNYKNYKNIVDDENYDSVDTAPIPIKRHWNDLKVKPYIFDPNDGYIPEDYSDYEHVCVFYDPSDYNSCITELGEELDDVNAKIGYENLDVLQEMINECSNTKLMNDPPVIFVRNERMGVEYEVTFDNGKY